MFCHAHCHLLPCTFDQVHFITSLVDILTAEAAKPIDQLAGAALAVSKNSRECPAIGVTPLGGACFCQCHSIFTHAFHWTSRR